MTKNFQTRIKDIITKSKNIKFPKKGKTMIKGTITSVKNVKMVNFTKKGIIIGSIIGTVIGIGTITGIAVGVSGGQTSSIIKQQISNSTIKVDYLIDSISWTTNPSSTTATVNIPIPTLPVNVNYRVDPTYKTTHLNKKIGDSITVKLIAKSGYQFEDGKTEYDYPFYQILPYKIGRGVNTFVPTQTDNKESERQVILNFLKSKHSHISQSVQWSDVTLSNEETTNADNTKNQLLKVEIADGSNSHLYYMLPQKGINENVEMKDGEYGIVYYSTGRRDVYIPYGVNEINTNNDLSFDDRRGVRTAFLPDTLKIINKNNLEESFFTKFVLTSLTLSESIEYLGRDTFNNAKLLSLTLPNKLTHIGNGAFAQSQGLVTLTIPDSVTHIGNSAFVTSRLRTLTLNEGLEEIGSEAFTSAEITELVLPSSLIRTGSNMVGFQTFDLTIKGPLNQMNSNTFEYATIKSLTLPESVTHVDGVQKYFVSNENDKLKLRTTGIERFDNENKWTNLFRFQELELSADVRHIGDNTFTKSLLTNLVIPQGVEVIGENAFRNSRLLTLTIPSSVQSIGSNAFTSIVSTEVTILNTAITIQNLRDNNVFGSTKALTDTDTDVANEIWIKRA